MVVCAIAEGESTQPDHAAAAPWPSCHCAAALNSQIPNSTATRCRGLGTLTGLTVGGNVLINAGGTLTLGGNLLVATDNAYNIGSGTARVKDIQVMTATFASSLTVAGTSSLAVATVNSLTLSGTSAGAAGRRAKDATYGLMDWGITGSAYDYTMFTPTGLGVVLAVLTGTNTLYFSGNTRANGQCNPNVDNSAVNLLGTSFLRWYDIRVMTGTFSGLLTAASLAVTGATTFSKEARLWNTTVAGLTAAGTAGVGATAFVTDSTLGIAAGLGVAVIGGGANKVPVYSDGANWIIG